jgi:catechol 2,3-dioxygenase-like lactoylglutathione lyase family enzyme
MSRPPNGHRRLQNPGDGTSHEDRDMFSHITVGVRDLDRASRFYDAVLQPLGLQQRQVTPDGGPPSRCWVDPRNLLPRFFAFIPFDGQPATAGNGGMVAFLAPSEAAVSEAHAAGLASGGTDEGAPGPRPHYGEGYYGAYLRDPDGNKVLVVHRGDLIPG